MVLLKPFDLEHSLHGRLQRALFPEARLMSLLIIAVKVSQSLDSVECRPRTDSEPAALAVNWRVWQDTLGPENRKRKTLLPGEEIKVTEEDVFRMNGPQLDQYLDWYQRIWIDDAKTSSKINIHSSDNY